MPKYMIICKACNTKHKEISTPAVPDLSPKCGRCGMERIAVEPVVEEIMPETEFDVFITNRRTNESVHHGFVIKSGHFRGLRDSEKHKLFTDEAARSLASILKFSNYEKLIGGVFDDTN